MKELCHPDKDFTKKAQENERENLESINKLSDKCTHLIKPTAVFRLAGDRLAFLFPWAEYGTLRDVWRKERPPSPFPQNEKAKISWMLRQVTGVCSALSLLAREGYRHSDLKPANLLCFVEKSEVILKIIDVGISKYHADPTDIRQTGTDARFSTHRYAPPEFDRSSQSSVQGSLVPDPKADRERLSRKYDVWSLGCILIEFMIWVQDGPGGHKIFDRSITTFYQGRTIHPDVSNYIKSLKDKNFFPEVLELVESKMLVSVGFRATADDVLAALRDACKNRDIDPDSSGNTSYQAPANDQGAIQDTSASEPQPEVIESTMDASANPSIVIDPSEDTTTGNNSAVESALNTSAAMRVSQNVPKKQSLVSSLTLWL